MTEPLDARIAAYLASPKAVAGWIREVDDPYLGLLREAAETLGRTCTWTYVDDETEIWETACGHAFVFTVDGPLENYMKFCCYCGANLVIASALAEPQP